MALGGVQQSITPTLLYALMQSETDPRVLAVRSLAKHIASDAKAKLAIERALNDPDWIIRREAYVALLNK